MDELHADDLLLAKELSPSERLDRALMAADEGFLLQLDALRSRHPDDSEEDLRRRLMEWLVGRDD